MRDRDLVRLHWPVELRPAFDALFGIDDAMAEVVASSSQPALGAIRLAWWREALERLDAGSPPLEPRLQAAAAELLPRGVTGAMLAGLEAGWSTLLEDVHDMEQVAQRGEKLFAMGAELLGGTHEALDVAGRLYGGTDAARRGYIDLVPGNIGLGGQRFARRVRPLTSLAVLAARDLRRGGPPFEPEATPGRALAIVSHRLFGKVTWAVE